MKPFIHKFKTGKFKYIYDVNTNRVFQVEDTTWNIIDDYLDGSSFDNLKEKHPEYSDSELRKSWDEIICAREEMDVFSSNHPVRIGYGDGCTIEDLLSTSPREQLILNITEQCNLRCKYCIYGGSYKYQRTHSTKAMSFSLAKKAIGAFLQHAKEKVHISFYGGEPLLAFDLIKQIISYTESLTTKKVHWSMTTNATLLTRDVADYLYKNKFILTVSVDGPKDIHDRYRVFPDGRGTFDAIQANLTYLRSLDMEYYKAHVVFSIVSAPPYHLDKVNDFFVVNSLVNESAAIVSNMNWMTDSFEYAPEQKDYEILDNARENIRDDYATKIRSGSKQDCVARAMYEKDIANFYHRSKEKLGDTIPFNGCCIPSIRRLFVSTDGLLYICEKIDNAYPIGSVDSWVDQKKVKSLIDEYRNMSEDCMDCWVCRQCSACFASYLAYGKLDRNLRRRECDSLKTQLHNMMVLYYEILEDNINAFDHLSTVSFS
jgi:uncharacterized protein